MSASTLSGKTCLITGATSGIGLEAAVALARAGATTVIVGRDVGQTLGAPQVVEARLLAGSGTVGEGQRQQFRRRVGHIGRYGFMVASHDVVCSLAEGLKQAVLVPVQRVDRSRGRPGPARHPANGHARGALRSENLRRRIEQRHARFGSVFLWPSHLDRVPQRRYVTS